MSTYSVLSGSKFQSDILLFDSSPSVMKLEILAPLYTGLDKFRKLLWLRQTDVELCLGSTYAWLHKLSSSLQILQT